MPNKLRQDTPQVTEFISLALLLTEAAATYAGEEYSDPETNAMLAKLQVVTSSLQTALTSAQRAAIVRPFPPVPGPPPPQPPEGPPPEPEEDVHPTRAKRSRG